MNVQDPNPRVAVVPEKPTMALVTNRRSLLQTSIVAAGSLAVTAPKRLAAQTPEGTPATAEGPFTLPDLPYSYDALQPTIDAETMELHHSKHHQAYVSNLNTAISDYPDLRAMPLDDMIASLSSIPDDIRMTVRNNAGGHWNHSMLWETIGPDPGEISAELAEAIDRDLGGMDAMMAALNEAATNRFGSGWGWVVSSAGTLSILTTPNQDNPLMDASGTPIFGVDVWEHAYYLTYRNRRPEYLERFWNVVNWSAVSDRFAASMQ
jgi:Fe-Mn family superoxide dismutase